MLTTEQILDILADPEIGAAKEESGQLWTRKQGAQDWKAHGDVESGVATGLIRGTMGELDQLIELLDRTGRAKVVNGAIFILVPHGTKQHWWYCCPATEESCRSVYHLILPR